MPVAYGNKWKMRAISYIRSSPNETECSIIYHCGPNIPLCKETQGSPIEQKIKNTRQQPPVQKKRKIKLPTKEELPLRILGPFRVHKVITGFLEFYFIF